MHKNWTFWNKVFSKMTKRKSLKKPILAQGLIKSLGLLKLVALLYFLCDFESTRRVVTHRTTPCKPQHFPAHKLCSEFVSRLYPTLWPSAMVYCTFFSLTAEEMRRGNIGVEHLTVYFCSLSFVWIFSNGVDVLPICKPPFSLYSHLKLKIVYYF